MSDPNKTAAAAMTQSGDELPPTSATKPRQTVFEFNLDDDKQIITPETTDVDLTRTRLREVPDSVIPLKHLQSLCLRWNLLSAIDENMTKLVAAQKLTHLDLYDNQITEIQNLSSLVNLEHLDISFNRLKAIGGIDQLTKLKRLYLVQNKIEKIENLTHNVQLELLELGANRIRKIENIDHLTNLKKLYLGANKIKIIENIDNLTQLHTLSLPANRIRKITGIETLSLLTELYLEQNGITEIPTFEQNPKLEILDLCNNLLTQVTNVSQLPLTDIWLRANRLDDLQGVAAALRPISTLRTLFLDLNPMCAAEAGREHEYRRRIMIELPQVTLLDARPTRTVMADSY